MELETLFSSNIIVPIIVAFIGFLIAVTTAVIAKEHKVSEFRKAWIDELRIDLSKFYAISYKLIPIYRSTNQNGDYSVNLADLIENNLQNDEVSARIILRLNWDEHQELLNNIEDIYKFRTHVNLDSPNFTLLHDLLSKHLKLSKNILSTEWKVVKQGEGFFIKFKYVSKLLASTFLIAMYVLFTIALLQSTIFQW